MANWLLNNTWSLSQENGSADSVDFDTDVIKLALTTVSSVPAPDSDTIWVNTNEVSGTNYTAGGETVTGMTASRVTTVVTINGDTVTWSQHASGFTDARYAWLYKDDTTDVVVATLDLGSNFGNVVSDLIIALPNGFFTKTLT